MRNYTQYRNPLTRLQLYSNSFFPSTVRLWNNLEPTIRDLPTIGRFKKAIKSHPYDKPPPYYFSGNRKLNILHTKLRHRCSTLNADLHRVHLVDNPCCVCGWLYEDAIHFFLECCLYTQARYQLKESVNFLNELTIETILFGDDALSGELNLTIFKSVQQYIKQTKRFDNQ